MTNTSTAQPLIENTQGDVFRQSVSFQDSNHTPRQSSFPQNRSSSRSNSSPRNFSPNNHDPNQSPEPNGSRNDLPHIQADGSRFTHGNGPGQIINATPGASSTTSVSNENSLNNINVDNSGCINHHYHIQGTVHYWVPGLPGLFEEAHNRGTGINTNQADNVPTTPTTKVDLGAPQSLNPQITISDLNTLREPVQTVSGLSTL